jgi:hypothetical protein
LYYETSLSLKVKDLREEYGDAKEDQPKKNYSVSNHYIMPASRVNHNRDHDNDINISKKQKQESVQLIGTDTNEAIICMQNLLKAKYNKRVHKESEETPFV